MKTLKLLCTALLAFVVFASCDKDEDVKPNDNPGEDLAGEVAGTYIGSISHNDTIYFADYAVTVTRINNTRVRCEGEDYRLPAHEFEIKNADPISGKDWITQTDTYQLDSVFTFVRENSHLTIIREDLNASFGGDLQK